MIPASCCATSSRRLALGVSRHRPAMQPAGGFNNGDPRLPSPAGALTNPAFAISATGRFAVPAIAVASVVRAGSGCRWPRAD